MTSQINEHKAAGEVKDDFMIRVELYQKKNFIRVGMFDPSLLHDLIEQIEDVDEVGEIEIFIAADNIMHDDTRSGLIVAKANRTRHFAIAGLTDEQPQPLSQHTTE